MTISAAIDRLQAKAGSRGIKFSPTLTEGAVADFESSNGLSLPPDYREFLLRVGNGGVGPPAYGLCALGQIPSDFHSASPDLSKPFPFTQPWVWEDGDASSEGGEADVYCGILILGTDGCGLFWLLIVRGPQFGKIWSLADVGITPTVPSMSFVEWYEAWLDGKKNW